jgi:hypothetical protein
MTGQIYFKNNLMEIGELGNNLAADVLKFWMECENRMLVNHQV